MNTNRIYKIAALTLTAAAALTAAGQAEAKGHPKARIIVVRPADLPELAHAPGQAMLLHQTGDGRTLLYIEQVQGARLAIFDVTDPAHVKQEGTVRLEASGSFDFVSPLGDNAELVRFRNGQGEAVLNLRKAKTPKLRTIEGLNAQDSIERLGDDGFLGTEQANAGSGASGETYQIVDLSNPIQPRHVADVQNVARRVTNDDTGTTFLLAADGLYLVRRPAVEEDYRIHVYQMNDPG